MTLRRRGDDWLIAALLALLAWALGAQGWSWRLDRVVYDTALTWSPRPVPEDIVIVAIDDASLAAIGRWPWSRAVHATLLQQLAAARPRAVMLDLVLSEPDPDPAQDALLGHWIAQARPVVMPVPWQQVAGLPPRPLEPVEPLRREAVLAQADPALDDDGLLRHAFLQAGSGERVFPHAALALLSAGGESPAPAALAATVRAPRITASADSWQRDDRLLVRFTGPPGHVTRVSYVDVLRGAVPAARLAGRYVLVGMTANGLGDAHATPSSGSTGSMPGIEIIANTLYTLRSGDAVREVAPGTLGLASGAAAALLVAAFGWLPRRRALGLATAAVLLALGASIAALHAGWWASPVPFAAAALLAYPLWSWRRLEQAMRGIDDEIARLHADDARAAANTAPPPPNDDDAVDHRVAALQSAGDLVRLARRFLSTTLDGLPAAVIVGDAAQRVLLANREAAALFEVEAADDLRGLDLARLLGEFRTTEDLDWAARLQALRPDDEPLVVETQMPGHGEHLVEVAAQDGPDGRRLIVTCADIGPIKQAQHQREEALAFVSHDLRSPASSIVLLADLALQGRAGLEPDALLAEMRRLGRRTLEAADDFVRTAQAEHQPLQREPALLEALAAQALADLGPQAQARGLSMRLRGSSGEPLSLDRALVTRAIANLVGNALRHSPDGGRVHVRVDGPTVSVDDDGPGLTDTQLERLASGRDVGAGRGDARGVGLGLVFVQRVARRHGGTLTASRRDGGGSRFQLRFPIDPAGDLEADHPGSGNP